MATEKILPAVMSGGAGSRLWPLSRAEKPKQFHALTGADSMLGGTLRRFAGAEFAPPLVICSAQHRAAAAAAADEAGLGAAAFILEPEGRNTAPAAVFAALHAREAGRALVLLAPADHHFARPADFTQAVAAAARAALDGALVTFGITPSHPETGYGYIRRGGPTGVKGVFQVDAFVEKPDLPTATQYVESGEFLWNAGVFLFSPNALLTEMARCAPEILERAAAAYEGGRRDGAFLELNAEAMAACPAESVDYAVMEQTARAAVAPIDPGWSDVGSWRAVWEIAAKDAEGNAAQGDAILVDSRRTLARSDGPLVVALGVEDLVVVATPDAVFVAPRDRAQDVREIVDELKKRNRPEAIRFGAAGNDADDG
ncbi:MAG: hypothetical protein Tsb0010_11240 [Parvularculaceae bacterium]